MNGIFIEEKLRNLKQREVSKKELLDLEEAKWKQKNRTWIAQGDEKIYVFHTYEKMRNKYNHCMSIKDERGEHVHSFKDMVEVGVNHFKNIFKERP